MTQKYGIKHSVEYPDADDIYNVIQIGRKNQWGEDFCIDYGLSYCEAVKRVGDLNTGIIESNNKRDTYIQPMNTYAPHLMR